MPVLHRSKKQADSEDDISELKLNAFKEDVNLYLNPTEGILARKDLPVWTVSSDSESPEGLSYKQVPGVRSMCKNKKKHPDIYKFIFIYDKYEREIYL